MLNSKKHTTMTNVLFNQKMSNLMTNAWTLVKNRSYTLSEAMKLAWRIAKIRTNLAAGIVDFTYIKKDGSIRKAKGTTKVDMMPKDASTFTGCANYTPLQVRYFDIEANSWRSFIETNLL